MPGLNQEAFSIITQILEFWQNNYFTEGIDTSDLNVSVNISAAQQASPSPILSGSTNIPQKNVSSSEEPVLVLDDAKKDEPGSTFPPVVETAVDTADVAPISERTKAPVPISATIESVAPAAIISDQPFALEQLPENTEPATATLPTNSNQSTAPISVEGGATALPVGVAITEIPPPEKPKSKNPLTIFGNTVSPILKSDGAWNFHTVLRFIRADVYTFETIFSRPIKKQPVPKATASVWFQLEKKDAIWSVNYRFESNHQVHLLQFDEKVTHNGISESAKAELARHASLLASPLKRMITIIESKELCSAEMDRIGLFKGEKLAAESKYCPLPVSI